MKQRLTVVTNSEVGTFRNCPQLHHFAYREGLRPKQRTRPLAIGSVIHDGLAAGISAGWAHRAAPFGVAHRVEVQRVAAVRAVRAALERWHAEVELAHDAPNYDELDAEARETASMAEFMVENYFDHASHDFTELELVAVEQPFNVALTDVRGRNTALRFAGVMDAVYYDRAFNQVVLDEHKTSAGDPAMLEKRLSLDPQTTAYVYALRDLVLRGKLEGVPENANVGRVRYNGLRKSRPRVPALNKDGTYSAAQIDTTASVYADALAEQMARGIAVLPKQTERLEQLRGRHDTYFARIEVYRSDAELERWRWETRETARAIRDAERDPHKRVRNPGHCTSAGSMRCTYRMVCDDPSAPELRTEFRIVGERHAEVASAVEASDKEW